MMGPRLKTSVGGICLRRHSKSPRVLIEAIPDTPMGDTGWRDSLAHQQTIPASMLAFHRVTTGTCIRSGTTTDPPATGRKACSNRLYPLIDPV